MRAFTRRLSLIPCILLVASFNIFLCGNQTLRADNTAPAWSVSAKFAKILQPEIDFDNHAIQLPQGFTLSKADSFRDGSRTQWHGALRTDGTRPVITVALQKLTASLASGDPIGYGVKLLQGSGSTGTTKYVSAKSETGIDTTTGNWITRFASSCILKSPDGIPVPLRSMNYVWLDHGNLIMATTYDADNHASQSLPEMEAAVFSVRAI